MDEMFPALNKTDTIQMKNFYDKIGEITSLKQYLIELHLYFFFSNI